MNETEIYIMIMEELRVFFDRIEKHTTKENSDDVRVALTIIMTDLLGQACSCFTESGKDKVKEELEKAIKKHSKLSEENGN